MYYIVYKNDEEQRSILSEMLKVNKFIYEDDNLEQVYRRIRFVYYDSIKDNKILASLNTSGQYDNDKDLYIRFYDSNKEYISRTLIDIITFLKSGKDSAVYFELFQVLNQRLYSKYTGSIHPRNAKDDICDLGLLAFSTRPNVNDKNDLINAFLYDREGLAKKYDSIMGDNSFSELCLQTFNLLLNYGLTNILSDYEFNNVINSLRDYFYAKMKTLRISENDKNELIKKFEFRYEEVLKLKGKTKKVD